MTDPFDEDEVGLEAMLLVSENDEEEIVIETPGASLTEDERIVMLVKALIVECAPMIVAALATVDPDE